MDQESGAAREIDVLEGLPPAEVRGLVEFVKTNYLDSRIASHSVRDYKERWSDDLASAELEWNFSPGAGVGPSHETLTVLNIRPQSVSVEFPGLVTADETSRLAAQRVADDMELLVTAFLTRAKGTSLYFVFSTGRDGSTKDAPVHRSLGGDALRKILSGNMTNLFLLIMAASFVLFFVIGDYAIFAVLLLQLIALFFSDRLALMVGKVRPTAERPKVTLVCVSVSSETRQLIAKYAKGMISEVRDRLQGDLAANPSGGPEAIAAVQTTLSRAGIKSSTEEIKLVTRDVYGLVKSVADRFGLPVPKVTIMNTLADNAAATGVSPGRSSIAITVGSLEDLGDEELSSVIGHEFGHIRGRDSLILFCVTFFVYFGGLFLWYPLLLFLGFFYYVFAFAIILSVGKILETRADTESVVRLGNAGPLAAALSKIGFRQLYAERYSPQTRLFDWLRFDPHPPIYFRVQRLSRLANGTGLGNTFLISVKDCVTGFFQAIW